ncbi:MAG: glycogen/starch/alpha-glucan phosphorylase, partial [Oscillospiraceae bacterium]|nr:glycogen/starch/alpha-glucan phosphorylase [Oscillospiraceae bacterium]
YQTAQQFISECYKNRALWNKMSLQNTANAGIFSADRAVDEYARNIWRLTK